MDELIKRLKELIEEEETVGKVTFEFKENDPEVLLIANRRKLLRALSELSEYRRHLYKWGDERAIIIEDLEDGSQKIITDKDMEKEQNREDFNPIEIVKDRHSWIKEEDVINKLDEILSDVYSLIEDY